MLDSLSRVFKCDTRSPYDLESVSSYPILCLDMIKIKRGVMLGFSLSPSAQVLSIEIWVTIGNCKLKAHLVYYKISTWSELYLLK